MIFWNFLPNFFFTKHTKNQLFQFFSKKISLTKSKGDSKGLKYTKFKEGFPRGTPGGTWEGINNVWLKDFEKFHSTIYFKNCLKNKILPELFRIIFGCQKMKRSPPDRSKIMIGLKIIFALLISLK